MFTREEVTKALSRTSAKSDTVFSEFLAELSAVRPHAINTEEGKSYIKNLVLNPDTFDVVVSWLVVIYNELVQNREATDIDIVYGRFYSSELLKGLSSICLDGKKVATSEDVVKNILGLLILYKQGV